MKRNEIMHQYLCLYANSMNAYLKSAGGSAKDERERERDGV
jgi:hypothetical protein